MPKINYTARCHCGALHFSFKAEQITEGVRCNCSICIRKSAIMSKIYFPAADFKPIENTEALLAYQWNDKVIDHLFCKTCGIYPYHGDSEMGYRINLGCVEQLDPLSLKISLIDGRSMPVSNDPGPHPIQS